MHVSSARGFQSLDVHQLRPSPSALMVLAAYSYTGRTMEATSSVLWDHFKKIPQEKLQSHIILRFNSYDTDHSGSLDRTEMREAMAEMGRRPSETELDDLMKIADQVGSSLDFLSTRCRHRVFLWFALLPRPRHLPHGWWLGPDEPVVLARTETEQSTLKNFRYISSNRLV